ncbi:MAG: hypothetical protein ABSB40_06570 [Nitrososphaeria archaeon]|jgi:GTPase SAR1 family protein
MKTAIFLVGDYNSGKSSIVRALTGCSRARIWKVINASGRKINALVILSTFQENPIKAIIPPEDLPNELERQYGDYELLICPIEISHSEDHKSEEYLKSFMSKKYDVKITLIEKGYDGRSPAPSDLSRVRDFASTNGITLLPLDISNSDEHTESRKIRDKLYPP